MIDYIIGSIDSIHDGYIVLNANSIGYILNASSTAINELSSKNGEIKVYTYLSVSENGINLYGFYDQTEREVFLKLTSVPKVGPKAALSILSLYLPPQLINYIVSSDIKALTKANGVGQKLAESIVFNLKSKFNNFAVSDQYNELEYLNESTPKNEAIAALASLGFEQNFCLKLVGSIYEEYLTVEELIGRALKIAGTK